MLVPGAPRASTRPRTWCARAGLSSSMGISLPAGSSGGAAHAAAAATRTTDLRLDERKPALRVVDALEMSRRRVDDHFERGTHARRENVSAAGRAVAAAENHVRMELLLAVLERDVAHQT